MFFLLVKYTQFIKSRLLNIYYDKSLMFQKMFRHIHYISILLLISECRFSDKRYELEDTWHPDLGPPFGVMYCVHCECVAVRF